MLRRLIPQLNIPVPDESDGQPRLVYRWRASGSVNGDEGNTETGEQTLDDLIAEIARLDEIYERQGLNVDEYQSQRKALMQKAKQLL